MPKPDVSSSRISKVPVLRDLRDALEGISGLDGVKSIGIVPSTGGGAKSRGSYLQVRRETEHGFELAGYQGPLRQKYFVNVDPEKMRPVREYMATHFRK